MLSHRALVAVAAVALVAANLPAGVAGNMDDDCGCPSGYTCIDGIICECDSYDLAMGLGWTSVAMTFIAVIWFRSVYRGATVPVLQSLFRGWLVIGSVKLLIGIYLFTLPCSGTYFGVFASLFGVLWITRGVMGLQRIKARQGLAASAAAPAPAGSYVPVTVGAPQPAYQGQAYAAAPAPGYGAPPAPAYSTAAPVYAGATPPPAAQ